MLVGGTMTVVYTALKLMTVAGTGIVMSTGYEWFHSFKFKSNKKESKREVMNHGYNESEHLREKLRSTR